MQKDLGLLKPKKSALTFNNEDLWNSVNFEKPLAEFEAGHGN
jgi:hypothetical protein